MNILYIFLIFLSFYLINVQSFAEWMLDEPYCSRKLELNEIIMNAPVVLGLVKTNNPADENYIGLRIYRNDELLLPLSTGKYAGSLGQIQPTYTYKTNDVLSVIYYGYSNGEIVYEISKGLGEFINGGCDNLRASNYYDEKVKLKLNNEENELVLIAGWAESHSSVSLSRAIHLIHEDSLNNQEETPQHIPKEEKKEEILDKEKIIVNDPHVNYKINNDEINLINMRDKDISEASDRTLSKPSSTFGWILSAFSPYTTQTRTETTGQRRRSRFAKTKETVQKLQNFVIFIGISLLLVLFYILYTYRFKLWKSYEKAIGKNSDK